jgi:hypothetical protein
MSHVNDRRLNLILRNTNCIEKLFITLFPGIQVTDLKSIKSHKAKSVPF